MADNAIHPPSASTTSTNPLTVISQRAQGKRKRVEPAGNTGAGPSRDGQPEQTSAAAAKRARLPPGAPAAAVATATPKFKRASDWHLRKSEIPPEAKKTKMALETHICILWGLVTQKAIPPKAETADKNAFHVRYNDEEEVAVSVSASLITNSASMILAKEKVRKFNDSLPASGTIANNIRRTGDEFLELIFRSVIQLGLARWAPDILGGDPDSMYNLVHEHIALNTFEQISVTHGYSHFPVNIAVMKNFPLLRHFYCSFVFSYMAGILKLEIRAPGGVSSRKDLSGSYGRRSSLGRDCFQFLQKEGFSEDTCAIAESAEAHSDDECVVITCADNTKEEVYRVFAKFGRSKKIKNFLRMGDGRCRNQALCQKGRKRGTRVERNRIDMNPEVMSSITTLPADVPIDYFDPEIWNNAMSIAQKATYMAKGIKVALPLEEHCQTWDQINKWKSWDKKKFMRRLGNDVLALYQMPTQKELDRVNSADYDSEEEPDTADEKEEPMDEIIDLAAEEDVEQQLQMAE